MMDAPWPSVRIAEIAAPTPNAICLGPFGSSISSNYFVPSGVPVVRGINLSSGRFFDDGFVYITEEKANELARSSAYPDDLVFTYKGTIGQVGIIPRHSRYPRYIVSQSQMKLSCDTQKADPLFIYYFFRSPKGQHALLANTSSTGTPGINQPTTTLKTIDLPLPPLPEQRAIACILGALDDKIELNRRMNETLEAIARALFTSWFVDFDPVRAKMEGREPAGMDAETAALFPNAFEESALGEVPAGWVAQPLPTIIDVNPSRSLPKGTIAPYLEMSNMPTQSARVIAWEDRPLASGMKFMNGDTLVARITPCLENGKTAYVDFLADGQVGWGSTEYIVLHSKWPLPPEYTYFLARSDTFRIHAIRNMTGTSGRQRVPAECFNSFLTVLPSALVAARFGTMAAATMAAMKGHDAESQTLTAIRDTLLPKLLSGEVRVGEAERLVEAVV